MWDAQFWCSVHKNLSPVWKPLLDMAPPVPANLPTFLCFHSLFFLRMNEFHIFFLFKIQLIKDFENKVLVPT